MIVRRIAATLAGLALGMLLLATLTLGGVVLAEAVSRL